jgi:pimeloyl-ACP methyl ester carboxylesterase
VPTVSHRAPGLCLTEHTFAVPLDHAAPDGEQIEVFAREVADPDGRDRPFSSSSRAARGSRRSARRRRRGAPPWLDRALEEFRVLLLDQRGTGRSSPIGALPGLTADEQAERLAHFRADAIVRDAELIRRALGVERWSVLGQSFGGFCVTTYLSLAPEGLREAFITGGLPAVGRSIDEVYAATYERMLERNRRLYERYPEDRDRVRALRAHERTLPSGDRLTAARVRLLGTALGMSDGPETVHHLLELPFDSPAFLHDAEAALRSRATRCTRSCTRRAGPTAASRAGRPSARARRPSTSGPSC